MSKNIHIFAVCAYKQSPYIDNCIKSLISQTEKTKIIITTSTPNEYIKNTAQKYNLELYSYDNGGIANDWNFALSIAASIGAKYVTLAHQDDIYLPEYAEHCIKAMEKSEALIAFTDYYELKNDITVKLNFNLRIKKLMLLPLRFFKRIKFVRRCILSMGNPICCPSVTYNIYKLSSFKFDNNFSVSLDWDALERISHEKGSFCYINRPLVQHRIHELSETTNAISDNRRSDEDLLLFRRFWCKPFAQILFNLYKRSQKSNN
jgi:glycosyltransferase involved in cell wall biosynthesis